MVRINNSLPSGEFRLGGTTKQRLVLPVVLFILCAVETFFHFYLAPVQRATQHISKSFPTTLLRGQSTDVTAAAGQCRFYLAESAIPRSGLGLFTAVDLQKGDEAQSMPDICIYVADTPADTHFWHTYFGEI